MFEHLIEKLIAALDFVPALPVDYAIANVVLTVLGPIIVGVTFAG